jgi:hypothetical protein
MIRTTSIHSRPSTTIFDLAGWTPTFPVVAGLWQDLLGRFFDPYRPELHYMRGPGPKWRERYGVAEANRSGAVVKTFLKGTD